MDKQITIIEQGKELAEVGHGDNPALVYLAGLTSKDSRRTMRNALDTIAGILTSGEADALTTPWSQMRFQHANMVRSALIERYAPATANKMLSALRGALKASWRLGQIDGETYHKAIDFKPVKGETLPAGRNISASEINALLGVCANDDTAAGIRDGAIIAVMRACGLRRAELVNLDLADYNAATGEMVIMGKGNKQRLAPVVNGAADALADWLTVRGSETGPLFLPIRKGGKVLAGRLTTQAVYKVLAKRAGQAGIADLSPHDFRRTFAGDLLDAGADISTVQRLMGHEDVTTTQRYDRRPEEVKRKAAELIHVPYRRRVMV